MYADTFPPAIVNSPPAYRSLPDTVSADTYADTLKKPRGTSIPEPRDVQLLPFHLAMPLASLPPAVVNAPPAYRSPPDTASADTEVSIPVPSGDQLLPSHLAMPLAITPPTTVKSPPMYRL